MFFLVCPQHLVLVYHILLGYAKKLMLQWGTDGDTTIRVNLDNPVDTPDGEAISLAMESIVSANVLQDSKGNDAALVKSAVLRETTVTEEVLF